jgi:hypothetical protein
MRYLNEHPTPLADFERMMLEHQRAASSSKQLDSGRFVLLAEAVARLRDGHMADVDRPSDQFAGLIHSILSSASGRHRSFKQLASLEYVLDALMFYAELQLSLIVQNFGDVDFEPSFGPFFAKVVKEY